jgi:hypothetical protein
MDQLEQACGDQFCVVSTQGEDAGTHDAGLLFCGEGDCFLMIDFTLRCFRLVECEVANKEPNPEQPRQEDLIIKQGGQEVFKLPKAPRKVRNFWTFYAMADMD